MERAQRKQACLECCLLLDCGQCWLRLHAPPPVAESWKHIRVTSSPWRACCLAVCVVPGARDPERGWDHSRVKGVVAKLVRVKDPAAATALEVAAGGRLYQVGEPGESDAVCCSCGSSHV